MVSRCLVVSLLAWLFATAPPLFAETRVFLESTGTYGIDNVVLENPFLKVTVSPHAGGRVVSFLEKPGKVEYAERTNEKGGLCHLMIIATKDGLGQYPGGLNGKNFSYTIVKQGPDEGAVEVETALSGEFNGLVCKKLYALPSDSRGLRVTFSITNAGYASRSMALRAHNWANIVNPEGDARFYLPTLKGIESRQNVIVKDFVAGWMAMISDREKRGFAAVFEYDETGSAFSWNCGDQGTTFEWVYRYVTLQPGEVWTTTCHLVPLPSGVRPAAISGDFLLSLGVPLPPRQAGARAKKVPKPLTRIKTVRVEFTRSPESKGPSATQLKDPGWMKKSTDTGTWHNRSLSLANSGIEYVIRVAVKESARGAMTTDGVQIHQAGYHTKVFMALPSIKRRRFPVDGLPQIRKYLGMNNKGLDVTWRHNGERVVHSFRLTGDSPLLYARVSYLSKPPAETEGPAWRMTLITYPGGGGLTSDRWIATAGRTRQHGGDRIRLTADEEWVFYYDRELDTVKNEKGSGPLAIRFGGQTNEPPEVNVGAYSTSTSVQIGSPGHFDMIVRNFPMVANDEALSLWRKEAPAIRERDWGKVFEEQFDLHGARIAGDNIRILQLSRWNFGEVTGPEKDFPEFHSVMAHARKHNFGSSDALYYHKMIYSQRFGFRAQGFLEYYLKGRTPFSVDVVYEHDFPGSFKDLYGYDILAIVDFPAEILQSYIKPLREFVERGGAIVSFGGYAGFGGRHEGYGSYRPIEELLPFSVKETSDWVCQDTYHGTFKEKTWHTGNFFECPVCGQEVKRFGPTLNAGLHSDWMRRGERISADKPLHPAVAGIPFSSISPSYHRVKAKEGTEIAASIDGNPIIGFQRLGEGMLAGVAISDFRKLYEWEFSGIWLQQLMRFLARKSPPVCSAITEEEGRITCIVKNISGENQELAPVLEIRSPEYEKMMERRLSVQLSPGKEKKFELPLETASWKPGRYTVLVREPGQPVLATDYFEVEKEFPLKVTVSFQHRSHFRPGQSIQPRIAIEKRPEPEITGANLYLRDERGVITKSAFIDSVPISPPPFSSYGLAYGRYAYVVEVLSGKGIAGYAKAELRIVAPPSLDVPVTMYGLSPCGKMTGDSYSAMAVADRLTESFNEICSISGGHAFETLDRAYPLGMYFQIRPAYLAPVKARDPASLQRMRKRFRDTAMRYRDFPAVSGCYLDDEGWGKSSYPIQKDWGTKHDPFEEKAFMEEHGTAMPLVPRNLEERLKLADFYIDSYSIKVREAALCGRAINPRWKQLLVQTAGRPAAIGGWAYRNFEFADAHWMDIYPATVGDVGEEILFANMLRTLQHYNHKPSYMMMGEYREDAPAIRMQFWISLMAGLKGYGWYSIGGGGKGIFRTDFREIERLNQIVLDHEKLVKIMQRPSSDVAVLFLKSATSFWSPRYNDLWRHLSAYYRKLYAVVNDLYRCDLVPDIISEDDMRMGRLANYSVVILGGGVEELPVEIQRTLETFAEDKVLMVTRDTPLKIAGAVPFDSSRALAGAHVPLLTPDPNVFAGILLANGMRYVVAYNHSSQSTDTELIAREGDECVGFVLASEEVLQLKTRGPGERALTVHLAPYDGKVIALLPARIQSVQIDLNEIRPGDVLVAGISLLGKVPFSGSLPVRVCVTRPDGYEITSNIVVTNGFARFEFATAPNDPRGNWTVDVEELISNRTTRESFTLE